MAETRIPSAHKALTSATTPDRVIQVSRQSPLSMNYAIREQMRNDDCDFQDLAQVLLLNRILAASEPGEDMTFQKNWIKFMGIKLPYKRDDLTACVAPLLNTSREVSRLVRATKALAFFELMLMCTAPKIFHKYYWLQNCSVLTVACIPMRHVKSWIQQRPGTNINVIQTPNRCSSKRYGNITIVSHVPASTTKTRH
ncbi:hypothetical protein PsorP6_000247 [Peronosclerospora sorghi]|uniref:Uncharacterized protein n=1 Tax=Peronosclerospora sorghi TaxID=230839 RepID=A0ACC0WV23_9STRA|nr:hypothetical protein PsorP6_000247 [Peronosclerospora sorghi]